jgi:hypothetical protein
MFKRVKGKKYNNIEVVCDGKRFDSKKEMQRYLVLKEAEKRGEINCLTLQPKFELIPAVRETYIKHLKTKDKECERTLQLAITYTADFSYYHGDKYIVEDVKASKMCLSDKYVLKAKMMFALKGIKIREIYKPNEPVGNV